VLHGAAHVVAEFEGLVNGRFWFLAVDALALRDADIEMDSAAVEALSNVDFSLDRLLNLAFRVDEGFEYILVVENCMYPAIGRRTRRRVGFEPVEMILARFSEGMRRRSGLSVVVRRVGGMHVGKIEIAVNLPSDMRMFLWMKPIMYLSFFSAILRVVADYHRAGFGPSSARWLGKRFDFVCRHNSRSSMGARGRHSLAADGVRG